MRGGREHAPPVTELSASTADMSTTTDTDEDTSVEIDGDNSANWGPSKDRYGCVHRIMYVHFGDQDMSNSTEIESHVSLQRPKISLLND